ncbi:MAG: hypothetical protein EPO20_17195 [Betaproteobacteria bacterium]|nr:MAG: hypothetical protein EPO20_17195 [Betaproteobacteria bacterium]
MKVKRPLVFVFASAAAMPFAAAFAQNNAMPSGPQGTGSYGNVSPFAVYDRNGDGVITAGEYPPRSMAVAPSAPGYSASPPASAYGTPSAGATLAPDYDRGTDRRVGVPDDQRARYPINGFSADTNPPVPAP